MTEMEGNEGSLWSRLFKKGTPSPAPSREVARALTDGEPLSDVQLIQRLKNPNKVQRERAYNELFERYKPVVLGTCMNILKDPEKANELTVICMNHAFENIATLRNPERFKARVVRIAHNAAVDSVTKGGRMKFIELDPGRIQHNPPVDEYDPEKDRQIEHALKRIARLRTTVLAPKHKEILTLFYDQKLTLQEIADKLSISLSAAKMRKSRALESLLKHLHNTNSIQKR